MHVLQCTGHPGAESHNPALWNERSHAGQVTVGAKRSPEVTPVVAHVATLQSLGHRFTDARTSCRIAGHNVAAPHRSPSFILGTMLSEVMSHQRLERPNAVSHLPWTLTPIATRICHQLGHSNVTSAHRVILHTRCCASPMRDCTPNIAQCTPTRILPSQAVSHRQLGGLESSSVLSRLLCTLLRPAIRTLSRKSANRCSCIARANNEGSTNCMPTPQL